MNVTAPQLRDVVEETARAGEAVPTCGDEAVAKIVAGPAKRPRQPGSARGLIHMADDFDEPLEDVRDYM